MWGTFFNQEKTISFLFITLSQGGRKDLRKEEEREEAPVARLSGGHLFNVPTNELCGPLTEL